MKYLWYNFGVATIPHWRRSLIEHHSFPYLAFYIYISNNLLSIWLDLEAKQSIVGPSWSVQHCPDIALLILLISLHTQWSPNSGSWYLQISWLHASCHQPPDCVESGWNTSREISSHLASSQVIVIKMNFNLTQGWKFDVVQYG